MAVLDAGGAGTVLVVNAGSTSLKLSAVAADESTTHVESLDTPSEGIEVVAHRVVHGGTRFREPVIVGDEVLRELAALAELAPLHNGPAIEAIHAAREKLPALPHVAVFDTSFHATLPARAYRYAVPRRWQDEWGIRRYGFHGLSVAWAAERVPVSRLVVCHLGGGCSVTAVRDGRSVETTMGFSPLEGVPMATRSGTIDPEIVLHVLRHGLATVEEVEDALERQSGLLGLSGVSARVEELEASPDPGARLALEVFAYRVAGAVAAAAVALDGLEALAFTAGVGERSARVRADVCALLAFLGVRLDVDRNTDAEDSSDLAAADSAVRVLVIHAREDVVAARAARRLLARTL